MRAYSLRDGLSRLVVGTSRWHAGWRTGETGAGYDGARVIIRPEEWLDGSTKPQADRGVGDLKLVYPETGFDAMTLCLGIVEIDPGRHSP